VVARIAVAVSIARVAADAVVAAIIIRGPDADDAVVIRLAVAGLVAALRRRGSLAAAAGLGPGAGEITVVGFTGGVCRASGFADVELEVANGIVAVGVIISVAVRGVVAWGPRFTVHTGVVGLPAQETIIAVEVVIARLTNRA
jgi:hypothetical protein